MYLNFVNLGSSKSKMSYSWQFWTLLLLYFHQYLHTCSSSPSFLTNLFEKWSQEHGKSYSSQQEKQYRIKVFEENYDYITQHNDKASSSYNLSLNAFADLTHHEFKAMYLLGQPRPSISSDNNLESYSVLESIATTKPISVGICGSNRAFQFYSEGVFTGPCCDTLDHSILLEGYGSRNGEEYWNVKNSWGKFWGRNGYMQLAIWNWNACGINREVASMNYRDKKTNSINPPLITPLGSKCFPVKCLGGATCCCYKRFIGQCTLFNCCEAAKPMCCKPNRSCCPQNTPRCDGGKSGCYQSTLNSTLAIQSKMGGLSAMLGY